jgi:hypothetical protein
MSPTVIQAKYGRRLPKGIVAGSITGVNLGTTTVTVGQGYVLQVLRANGYRALSQTDARAIVLKAQGTGLRAAWGKYSPLGVKIIEDVKNLAVLQIVNFSPAARAALVSVDAIASAVQPDVSTVINQIYQAYDADGVQPLMQLPPGAALTGTLLFDAPVAAAPGTAAATFTINVPVSR